MHVVIADDIRLKIQSGEYQPDAELPALAELSEHYGCSLAPVRSAVLLLQRQGLVVSRRGRRSRVRRRTAARRHSVHRYARHIWSTQGKAILDAEAEMQGTTAGQIIRELTEAPAPPVVSDHLGIPVGTPVWVRRRTTLWGDRRYQLADSYYPLDVSNAAPRIQEENTGPGGGFARIEEAGIRLDVIDESVSVRMPTGPEMVALALPGVTPVADLVRVTYDDTGRPIEVMLAVIAGDLVEFHSRGPIPD